MNPRLNLCLILLCTLLASGNAWSQTGGEVAVIAGATAGAMIIPPVAAQALTYSVLDVKVEAYTESLPLDRDPKMTLEQWLKLPPNQKRSAAFSLGGPSALYRTIQQAKSEAADEASLTTAKALLVADRIVLATQQFQDIAKETEAAKKQIDDLKNPSLASIAEDFAVRNQAATNVVAAIRSYVEHVKQAMTDANMSEAELSTARERLLRLRLLLADFPREYSANTADLFASQLKSIFVPSDKGAIGPKANTKPILDKLNVPKIGTPEERMSAIVAAALEVVRGLKPNQGLRKKVGEGQINEAKFESELKRVFKVFGFTVSVEELSKLNSASEIQAALSQHWLQVMTTAQAEHTLRLTYVGVAIGANLGPLVNEAFQGIFSKGQLIDSILQEDKWKLVNYAYSKSHAGDHNAIIYFDNILTPVLKSATFDPSQFIAANAQLHRRVSGAMAEVFGVPLAPGEAPSTERPELNLFATKARKVNADKAAGQHREALLAALKELIDLHDAIQQQVESGAWKGADDADKKATAKSQLDAAKSKLDALTQTLQKREAVTNP